MGTVACGESRGFHRWLAIVPRPATDVISTVVSRASAALLLCGGLGLLFVPDLIFGAVLPGMPAQAYWLGQLLAAAWLGVATLNWLQRSVVIGGIYARPLVATNCVLYLVSALSLVRVVTAPAVPWAVWVLAVLMFVMAAAYAALMFRGPFDALVTRE